MAADDLWLPWVELYGKPGDEANYSNRKMKLTHIENALKKLYENGYLTRYPVSGEYDVYVYDYPSLGRKQSGKGGNAQ
jgi:hypothetical protein